MGGGWSPQSSHVVFEAGSWRDNRGSFISQTQWGKRHNGSHAESMPAIHWTVHAGLKQAHTSRSNPEKKRGDMTYKQNKGKEAENAVWRDSFDGEIFNMFGHHLKENVQHIVGLLQEMSPAFGWQKDRWERNHRCQTTFFFNSVIYILFMYIYFYPSSLGTPEPWCYYTALCVMLSRHICIEKLFAYQTAGPQSSHHLSLIYREMLMLTCWSACPLYLHLPFVGIS